MVDGYRIDDTTVAAREERRRFTGASIRAKRQDARSDEIALAAVPSLPGHFKSQGVIE
jgi:hypothetical protein